MKIIIAGPGCSRCLATEQNVINACSQINLPADVSHVYDPKEYAKIGVRVTPSVIVDGKIVISGKVPTVEELKKVFTALSKQK